MYAKTPRPTQPVCAAPTGMLAVPLTVLLCYTLCLGCSGSPTTDPRAAGGTLDSTLVDNSDAPSQPGDPGGDEALIPELRISVTPAACCDTLSYDLEAHVEPALTDAVVYEWVLGDGRTAQGKTISHTYPWPDDYAVSVVAELDNGLKLAASETVAAGLDEQSAGSDADGGSSGSGDDPDGPSESDPPVADAGPDVTVAPAASVTLDASSSQPAHGGTLSYAWAQWSGPSVDLAGAEGAVASFTAPTGASETIVLVFELTVAEGALTAVDRVTVTVEPGGSESPPAEDPPDEDPPAEDDPPESEEPPDVAAHAGADQTVAGDLVVHLDGSGSTPAPGTGVSYSWAQLEGPAVTLSNPADVQPTFTSPSSTTAALLLFELTVTAHGLSDSDTVTVVVLESGGDVVSQAPPGVTVWFLTGPEGDTPTGPAEVSWQFVGRDAGVQDVRLIVDCCDCWEEAGAVLYPDDEGVYSATITVPPDETIWYSVFYTADGLDYRSQSVYVNVDDSGSSLEPAPVIWYHARPQPLSVLDEVARTGVVTHVMIGGSDRVVFAYDDPMVLAQVARCQQLGMQVIWSRHLWNNYTDFETVDDTFDSAFYADVVATIQEEATVLGVPYTAVDCECYSGSPLFERLTNAVSREDFALMLAATEDAGELGRVDYSYPCGNHGNDLHPLGAFGPLSRYDISESTYYDQPHKNCRITYPYQVFGAFIQPTTERDDNADAPYFLPYDVVLREYLWQESRGATPGVNGLFLYAGSGPDDPTPGQSAAMLADYLDALSTP